MLPAGEGGIFCTDSREYYERALLLGHFGRLDEISDVALRKFSSTGLGFKYRPHPLAVTLAHGLMDSLPKRIAGH